MAAQQNNLLQNIHERTQYWRREVGPDGKDMDMRHIEMTLGERTRDLVATNKKFEHDFAILTS